MSVTCVVVHHRIFPRGSVVHPAGTQADHILLLPRCCEDTQWCCHCNHAQAHTTLLLCMQAASTTIASAPATNAKLLANLGNTTLLNRLRPLLAGSGSNATLTGRFGGAEATPLGIIIGGASTQVTVGSLALSATWCTSGSSDVQCSSTFAGVTGATSVLEVRQGPHKPCIAARDTNRHAYRCCSNSSGSWASISNILAVFSIAPTASTCSMHS